MTPTLNAKDTSTLFHRPLSTLYRWAERLGVGRFDDDYSEVRFDPVAVALLCESDRRGLRQYLNGSLPADRLAEVRSNIGVGARSPGLAQDALVPLLVDPSTPVAVTLRAQLFADAEAAGTSPVAVLIAAYAASRNPVEIAR